MFSSSLNPGNPVTPCIKAHTWIPWADVMVDPEERIGEGACTIQSLIPDPDCPKHEII